MNLYYILEVSSTTPRQFRVTVFASDRQMLDTPPTEGFSTIGIYKNVDHAMTQLTAYLNMESTQ
jgi:hypothetical protein